MDQCLDIPLPGCIGEFRCLEADYHLSAVEDEVVRLIRSFGESYSIPESEIQKYLQLAQGGDDLVILLERPVAGQDYTLPFEKFIENSKTLNAVDELLRFASGGRRSIHNVSIINAYSFKPKAALNPPNKACHDLVKSILQAKLPRAVLGCTGEIDCSHWLGQFCASSPSGKLRTTTIHLDPAKETMFISSFHPSYCINWFPTDADLRLLLIYHFCFAIFCLSQRQKSPEPGWMSWATNIQ